MSSVHWAFRAFWRGATEGKKKEKKVSEVSLLDDWHIALLLMLGDLDDL